MFVDAGLAAMNLRAKKARSENERAFFASHTL
jgi:hypothetical protein